MTEAGSTSTTPADVGGRGAERVRRGTPVVPGIAVGPVIRPTATVDISGAASIVAGAPDQESERFAAAVGVVAGRLQDRSQEAHGVAAEVLTAQVGLVTDKGLRKAVDKSIAAGSSAEASVVAAVDQFAAMFEQVGGLMAERVTDLRDLGGRVYAELQGLPEPGIPRPDVPSVLIAEDLAPADTSGLDPSLVIALATSLGGPTSHTAIIARQLGIPCVVAAPVDDIPVGAVVLVNGGNGEVVVDPDLDAAAKLIEIDATTRSAAASWQGPGATSDGAAIAILANVQDGPSARKAAETPCEGVGLFRSELAFLGRDTEPTVDEQAAEYAAVFAAFGERKVVIRTLDAGSDKPMKFATLPDEPNPALGVRGLRLSWGNPGLLTRQLDAIAAGAESTGTEPWVMAPMVATAQEAADFAGQVRERGLTPGVMIEVPAAALLAERLLEHVEFLSIGTNDLSQYTMAADRLSGELAGLTDSWQPAVLQLIAMTAAAGKAAGKPVGVCGEAAADPLLACVLFGLGITSLSMATSAIGQVGASISAATSDACRAAAAAALAASDPAAARTSAAAALDR
ncbi:MAG TPA: putative PEP-binding protein [Nocardioidaceae bacterium]|nr:putative PEP-binding protein [Nocardioidaceae bacterium]